MSVRHVRKALEVQTLTSPQKFVLVVLAEHANDETGDSWPSASKIANETALSESAVRKALSALRDQGFISVKYRANTVHSSTTYSMFPEAEAALFPVQGGLYVVQGDPCTSDRGTPVRGTGKPEVEPEVEPERNRAAFVNSAVGQTIGMAKDRNLMVMPGKVRAVAGALFSAAPATDPGHFARAYVALRMQGKSPTAEMVADNIAGHTGGYGGNMRNANTDYWESGGEY